jgi:hypothetical protein
LPDTRDLGVPNSTCIDNLFASQLVLFRIVFDSQHQAVFPFFDGDGNVERKGCMTALMRSDRLAIDERFTSVVDRFEVQDSSRLRFGVCIERATIPKRFVVEQQSSNPSQLRLKRKGN